MTKKTEFVFPQTPGELRLTRIAEALMIAVLFFAVPAAIIAAVMSW